MANLMKNAAHNLRKKASGNLRLWSNPTWHNSGASSTSWSGYTNFNPESTKTNININPTTGGTYTSTRASAVASFAAGTYRTSSAVASVGNAYGQGGAARATVEIGALVYAWTPAALCSQARIAVNAICQIGVFTAAPSASQILDAMEFTPSSGYVGLTTLFLDVINYCFTNATPCYVSVCRPPPLSISGEFYQNSFYNDYGEAFDLWGWCPCAIEETIYWKTGSTDPFTYPVTSAAPQTYY